MDRTMRIAKLLLGLAVLITLAAPATLAQLWTPLTNQPGANVGVMIQLRDGRILVHEEQQGNSRNWHILTPDSTGSYVNGTWSSGGSLPAGYSPWYFSTQVLFGGGKQVLVEGGEYNNGSSAWTTLGALGTCAPFGACSWVSNAQPSGWANIGDAQSVILSNGKYLQANCCSTQTAEFKSRNTWVLSTNTGYRNDEQGFTLLPSGQLLMVDAWQNAALCGNSAMSSELRSIDKVVNGVYTMGTWSCGPHTTAQLWDSSGHELGPVVLTYDSTNNAIAFGATNNSSVYHISSNTFTSGPTPAGGLTAYDAPASLEPNGKVLVMLGPSGFGAGCQFEEYDPATNTLAATLNPTDCPGDPSFVGHLMILPTGQIMFTDFSGLVEIYTPKAGNVAGTAPVITSYPGSVTHGVTNYVLKGKQLNGLTQNNAYGDDYQGDTNYPLMYLSNGNQVYWLFTHNDNTHSIAKNVAVTTHFDVPASVPPGAYTLFVVANGVKSTGVAINVL